MRKYLFLLTAATVASPALGQSTQAEVDAAIAAAQAEAAQAGAQTDTEQTVPNRAQAEREERIVIADSRVEPSTITVTGFATDLDATGHAVTVIDRAEIEAVQGPDIARVLARAPGVAISRNGPLGAFTGVRLRGGDNEQLLVLVDGVRVADPAAPSGGFDFGTLATGTLGKIELLRGSNSTIWGADAVAGVMALSTRLASGASGSVEFGADSSVFAQGAGGADIGRGFIGLGASYVSSDGFSAAANGTEDDGYDQLALTGSAFYDATDQVELFVNGRYAQAELDIDGFPAPSFALADTREIQDTRQLSGAVGANYYGQDLTLKASFSASDTARDNLDAALGRVSTFASDGASQEVSLRGEYRLIGGIALAFGGNRQWTQYSTSFDAEDSATITGAYVQAGGTLLGFAGHIGARIDDHDTFCSEVSFGGDASYLLGGGWRIRASVGEGFKPPSLYQLYSSFGNLALEPEKSTSYDAGIEHGERGRGLFLALTGFRRDSENLIGFDNATFTYANTARARAQGLEAEAGLNFGESLRVAGHYTLLDAENRVTGTDLARRPRHSATLWADWGTGLLAGPDTPGLTFGADLRLVGDSFDDAGNFVRLDGYELLDLRAELPVSSKVQLFGRVENLLDEDYQTAAGYATRGRSAFVGVRAGL